MTSSSFRNRLQALSKLNRVPIKSALIHRSISVAVATFAATATIVGARQLGMLQFLELRAYDQLLQLRPDRGPDPRLLTVTITEEDIQNQKKWPLPDLALDRVLGTLEASQPRAIGLDLVRDLPQEPGYTKLTQRFQNSDRIITICKSGEVSPPPSALPENVGFADILPDPDGVVRRNLFSLEQTQGKCTTPYSLALQLAALYLSDEGIEPQQTAKGEFKIGSVVFKPLESRTGGYQGIDASGYQIMLNYRSRLHTSQEVTLTDLLAGKVNPNLIRNRVVLVGVTAPSLKDAFYTPYSAASQEQSKQMPGVILHAQMVSEFLSAVLNKQPLIWTWPHWVEILWIGGWALVGGSLAWAIRRPLILGVAELVGLGALLGICWGLFAQGGWVPLVPPAFALIATGGSILAYSGYQTQQEHKKIQQEHKKIELQVKQQEEDMALLKALLNESREVPNEAENQGQKISDKVQTILSDRYKIVRVLGSGGFGQTYLSQDTQRPGNPYCVVKYLQPAQKNPAFLQVARRLFNTEAEILEKLGIHPQIPRLLAYFEENQEFYIVQEFIEGHPLSKELIPNKPLPESQVVELLKGVLEILVFVHEYSVIHRDIKPDNIIRRKEDNKLVLIDFGAVKQIQPQSGTEREDRTVAVGTTGYSPPEQLYGQPKLNSDIYALGMIGIQALIGVDPSQLEKDPATGEVVWRDRAQVSQAVAAIVNKMVRYNFAERYQSATQVLHDLAIAQ